jgi:hypothetical protein
MQEKQAVKRDHLSSLRFWVKSISYNYHIALLNSELQL